MNSVIQQIFFVLWLKICPPHQHVHIKLSCLSFIQLINFHSFILILRILLIFRWTDCGASCARRDIDAYMQQIVQWREDSKALEGGFTDVYVATDGDTVMEELLQVSFNNYDRAEFRIENELMIKFYDAIKKFDNLANKSEFQWRHILKPGELLIFNNWRVLHGRGSFQGKRKMAGCYINMEDFESICKINDIF